MFICFIFSYKIWSSIVLKRLVPVYHKNRNTRDNFNELRRQHYFSVMICDAFVHLLTQGYFGMFLSGVRSKSGTRYQPVGHKVGLFLPFRDRSTLT